MKSEGNGCGKYLINITAFGYHFLLSSIPEIRVNISWIDFFAPLPLHHDVTLGSRVLRSPFIQWCRLTLAREKQAFFFPRLHHVEVYPSAFFHFYLVVDPPSGCHQIYVRHEV